MFIDQAKISVAAGKGGDGMVAFRREKYEPNGGPSGGDGGKGGSVFVEVDPGLNTLMKFRYNKLYKAKNGQNGQIKGMYGRGANDEVINVPPGTLIIDDNTGEVLADMTYENQRYLLAKGGRGGRGNIHFKSSKNSAPEISENGEPGEFRDVRLELKVIADVGLVGFPSVGKSTLLSVASKATPKIASYEFTTLNPNLGMVQLDNGADFSMADLPGLIEGAAQGVGLGFLFLRHIERTKVILHLVDVSPESYRDPYEDILKINKELLEYDENITKKPQLIVPTKMDMPGSSERLAELEGRLKDNSDLANLRIFPISSINHQGIHSLLQATSDLVQEEKKAFIDQIDETIAEAEYNFTPDSSKEFTIERDDFGVFIIKGENIERLYHMANLDYQDGVLRFAKIIKNMGVESELRKAGAKNGDTVQIDNFMFDFVD